MCFYLWPITDHLDYLNNFEIFRCTWTLTLGLPKGIDITFRYVVCCVIEPETNQIDKKVVLRRWETFLWPRKIACHGTAQK